MVVLAAGGSRKNAARYEIAEANSTFGESQPDVTFLWPVT